MNHLVIIIIASFVVFVIVANSLLKLYEHFDNEHQNINTHIIHLERSTDRLENIEKQKPKIGFPVTIFNAVDAKNINRQELIDRGELSPEFSNTAKDGEIGCYLSHRNLIKEIAETNGGSGYSIIFEDDLDITVDNFQEIINKLVNEIANDNIDFDIIYIGDCFITDRTDNDKISKHLYIFNESNITTVAYIINNKTSKQLYGLLNNKIVSPIDNYLTHLNYEKKIKSYVLQPKIVKQNRENYTSIIQG
jgi:GR25 family glycosyltransferase involved in LPS biosynthesis